MSITLQSTAGGFSASFMRVLPAVEQAMTAHGLEPSQFVIAKDRAAASNMLPVGPFFFDYTVFSGDEHFTVTEPNDMVFIDYLYQRILASDQPQPRTGLISRFLHWMAQPI